MALAHDDAVLRRRHLPSTTLGPLPWVVLALGAAIAWFVPGPVEGTPVRITLVVTLGVFFAALVARLVLAASEQPARRPALLVLAGSVALWAIGSATVSAEQTVEAVAFPAPGEVLCFASYVGLAAFLLLDAPRRVATRAAVWLEATVICGAAVCLAAFPLLTPLTASYGGDPVRLVLAILYPLINVVMAAFVLAQLVVRRREPGRAAFALAGGFVGVAVADSSFLVDLAAGVYTTSLTLAALWGASFALVVAGATARRPTLVTTTPTRERSSVVVVAAVVIALVVLLWNPPGVTGWVVKVPAVVTLACAAVLMSIALREARGAAEAMRLSLTDELTRMPNRRALQHAVDEAVERDETFGVLLLDLDGFKDVNDSLGHTVGDDVLVTLAHRMRSTLEPSVLLSRLGGDEFALLVPGDDELRLFETAQHLRRVLREPLRVHGMDVSLDASVGITVRENGTTAAEMLRRADIAMYQAKHGRAGVLLFEEAYDGLSQHRLVRGEALRQAVLQGQLVVWYQPQIDARTRDVVAMEALVRWQHPTDGLLPPVAFLADARESGVMPALTESVMRQVVADARRWADDGLDFRVAMNWAPPEVVGGRLLPRLVEALAEAGVAPERFIVEVTEDSFLAEPERAREVLLDLRRHGVQVAIDDYGTGFSSLTYLRDLPVQEIKLDRSFITPVARDERSRLIVQTTAQMARAFGMRLVAEGVEDAVAAAELLPMGVDVLQGYHIARPMPGDEVAAWVRHWQMVTRAAGPRVAAPGSDPRAQH